MKAMRGPRRRMAGRPSMTDIWISWGLAAVALGVLWLIAAWLGVEDVSTGHLVLVLLLTAILMVALILAVAAVRHHRRRRSG